LTNAQFLTPGWKSIFLFRPKEAHDFTAEELVDLGHAYEALCAAERRCARVDSARTILPILEAILKDTEGGAHLVFGENKQLIWLSTEAGRLFNYQVNRECKLPREMLEAVNSVMRETATRRIRLTLGAEIGLVAEVRKVASQASGNYVLVHVLPRNQLATERALGEQFDLTPAEVEVLMQLAAGLSNEEIAHHRKVSITTVRTQVARILDKMGVHTRLQAALMALRQS
ncbi:MAG TPA: LuxR C-terminal-related transcriptional regulator, partial [bacterium]|nr:LuxR C-terminal-related transcriptional regulator [bacterium]